ncbi:hypothetical protein EV122DRAFT_208477 [Schizophyllum commune]
MCCTAQTQTSSTPVNVKVASTSDATHNHASVPQRRALGMRVRVDPPRRESSSAPSAFTDHTSRPSRSPLIISMYHHHHHHDHPYLFACIHQSLAPASSLDPAFLLYRPEPQADRPRASRRRIPAQKKE